MVGAESPSHLRPNSVVEGPGEAGPGGLQQQRETEPIAQGLLVGDAPRHAVVEQLAQVGVAVRHVHDPRQAQRPGEQGHEAAQPAPVPHIAAVAIRSGHDARPTYSGEEALQALQTEPFEVLITDYGMEGLSGPALAEKARRLHPGIKVVLVTGWDVSIEEFDGFVGLLKKPCTRAQVEEMLRSLTA